MGNLTFADLNLHKESTYITGYCIKSGLTNQFKVFGTVANATIDLIKKEKLNSITFTAKERKQKKII